jgi:hypothetical protein
MLVALTLAGCGYHLAGSGTALPETARTIAIRQFRNNTREHGIEVRLQRAPRRARRTSCSAATSRA